MGPFETLLRKHDWSYSYSDDSRVWKTGSQSMNVIRAEAERLGCPFTLTYPSGQVTAFLHNMVLDLFEETLPGRFQRIGYAKRWDGKSQFADTYRTELITREEFNQVQTWFAENDKGEA